MNQTPPPSDDQPTSPHRDASPSIRDDLRGEILTGALLCGGGILVGLCSLVLCCFAFGANFQNEGWGDVSVQSTAGRQIPFVVSLIGFGVAIPVFWLGFFRLTDPGRSAPGESTNR